LSKPRLRRGATSSIASKAVSDAILINNGVIYQYVGDQIIGLLVLAAIRPEELSRHDSAGRHARRADDLTELSDEFGTTLEIGIRAHLAADRQDDGASGSCSSRWSVT
jgi:hypothetical protein